MTERAAAAGTGGSVLVETCQVCDSAELATVFFAGYLPPVNTMDRVGSRPVERPFYPAELLKCRRCTLFQLGLTVDPHILFPASYPYTSGSTKLLRDNFAQLYAEVAELVELTAGDLVVDIGSNDGTLLSNFRAAGHRVLGIEPTDQADTATARGVPSLKAFFGRETAERVVSDHGRAALITAANVFAHIERVNDVVEAVADLLVEDGVFVTESHYLVSLLETVQYDTIYHEHLRYYSLGSLKYLLAKHGLEVWHARRIPTHGGSVRVYAARKGKFAVRGSVAELLALEEHALDDRAIRRFVDRVVDSKLGLDALLRDAKTAGKRIYGVGAPSRASTLINYVGLSADVVEMVLETSGSGKIGKYVPGTLIPITDESPLTSAPPDYLLLFAWHIADELMSKLRAKGFTGRFMLPLPEPRIL